MKLVLFNNFVPGILHGDLVVDISEVVAHLPRSSPQQLMESIIQNYVELRPALQKFVDVAKGPLASSVRLCPPLPRPRKILCAIGNYREGTDRTPLPLDFFIKSSEAVIGPGGTVVLPERQHDIFHHEAELGVIIGSEAHNVAASEAMEYVFGYTAFMDVSGRGGIGKPGFNSFLGKSYNTFAPLGPSIVTADSIGNPHKLAVRYWVNGHLRHDYNTDDMEHPIPSLIEFASSVTTLLPGDIIACGTNHQGLGPLQDGDVGEIEVEGIGRFSINVVDPLKRSWPVGIDDVAAARVREGRPTTG
jgi:2-keto-4-pentenoate hydratase/2-oxohepta-3-ene-1,7-dioic acid hydratase in catechol pathway